MTAVATQTVVVAPARAEPRSTAAVLASALRLRQWTKNVLLFAALVFARRFDEPRAWLDAVSAFLVFCAISSAAYLVNDVRDADLDALHPAKCARPVASGELSSRHALALAAGLAVCGAGGAALLGPAALGAVLAFTTLQLAYSLWLKRVVLVDVVVIALLFVVRAVAGAGAVRVSISVWLLACTALLAVFLALAKRRAELALVMAGTTTGRPVLRRYPAVAVERLVMLVGTATLAVYVAYALAGPNSAMALTVPFVAGGLLRYQRLLRHGGLGEAPDEILLTDPVIWACVGGWVVTAGAVLLVA